MERPGRRRCRRVANGDLYLNTDRLDSTRRNKSDSDAMAAHNKRNYHQPSRIKSVLCYTGVCGRAPLRETYLPF